MIKSKGEPSLAIPIPPFALQKVVFSWNLAVNGNVLRFLYFTSPHHGVAVVFLSFTGIRVLHWPKVFSYIPTRGAAVPVKRLVRNDIKRNLIGTRCTQRFFH